MHELFFRIIIDRQLFEHVLSLREAAFPSSSDYFVVTADEPKYSAIIAIRSFQSA